MTKTSFELELKAETLVGAQALAEEQIAAFLGATVEDVTKSLDMEFRVKTDEDSGKLKVVVFANLKRNSVLNIGTL
jgi:hypothetical protein